MQSFRRRKENEVQKAIVNALSLSGWVVIHIPNQATRGRQRWAGLVPGVPDLIALRRGRIVFIEVKTDTGKVRLNQSLMHELIRQNGFEVRVARGIDDIQDLLEL